MNIIGDPTPPRFVEQTLSGWGRYPVERCRVYRPHTVPALDEVVAGAAEGGLIARGLGRSYGDAALNGGGGVLLSRDFRRMRSFDVETGVLDCEAAVTIDEIVDTFLPRGWFVPVTPGTRFVTVGGAVACDVHGKNHHRDGSIASFLLDLTLRTASGETIVCSPADRADVFWATVGGMGLTGFILRLRLRLIPVETAYIRVDHHRARNLDEALERFETLDAASRYSVAWIDCLARGSAMGRSVLMHGEHATPDELPAAARAAPRLAPARRTLTVPVSAPGWLLNPLTVGAFNGLYYRLHRSRRLLVPFAPFFYPLDAIRHWNRLYGRGGFVQYQLALPDAAGRDGLVAVLERLARARMGSFLAVFKRFGDGNPGLLSFPFRGYTLALDLPRPRPALRSLLRELDEIVLERGGRVYLAKDATLSREAFAAMYPGAAALREIRRRLDPEGRVSSSLARRLGL